jgi:hypothetical protein
MVDSNKLPTKTTVGRLMPTNDSHSIVARGLEALQNRGRGLMSAKYHSIQAKHLLELAQKAKSEEERERLLQQASLHEKSAEKVGSFRRRTEKIISTGISVRVQP